MEYQITINKYELNILKDAVRCKLGQEQERFTRLCKCGDMVTADLCNSTITSLYMLIGKLTNVVMEAETIQPK